MVSAPRTPPPRTWAAVLLVALLLLVGLPSASHAQTLRLGPADEYELGPLATVIAATPDETIDDYDAVVADGRFDRVFDGAPADRLALGGEIWVRATLENPDDSPQRDWVLWAPRAAQVLDARIAIAGADPTIVRNGYFVPPQERPLYTVGYAFPLTLEPGQRADVVLRAYLPPREAHRLVVMPAERFRFHSLIALLLVFGVMGAALALGSYNLVMFAVVRERAYGWYALYALSSVFLWGTVHSVLILFTRDGRAALTLNGFAVLLTGFAALRFTHDFLELSESAPRIHRLFQGLTVVLGGLFVALLVLPQPQFKLVASIVGVPTMAAVVIAPIYLLGRGYRRARFMVIGWAPLMFFPVMLSLRSLGVIDGRWVSTQVMLSFHGFEILTMALALGDRWRELEKGRRRAQDDAMAQMKLRLAQTEELVQAQNASRRARIQAEKERLKGSLDALTGLRNRRAFDSERPRVELEPRAEEEMLLFVLDVDGLKQVNDELGHAEGDRLLAQLGEQLARSLRDGDRIYRLGGDEFAVVARAADDKAAAAIERRIREAVGGVRDAFPQVDASVGVARLSETEGDPPMGWLFPLAFVVHAAAPGGVLFGLSLEGVIPTPWAYGGLVLGALLAVGGGGALLSSALKVKGRIDAMRRAARGMPAQAAVLRIEARLGNYRSRNAHGTFRASKHALTLDVWRADGQRYQTTLEGYFHNQELAALQPGATIQVHVDPSDPHTVFVPFSRPAPVAQQGPSFGVWG